MRGSVSRETSDRLDAYEALIQRWNPRINLVAPSTLSAIRERHIDDSLQLAILAQPQQGHWVDLGSGGGLPGIVLAIEAANRPVLFTLIESDGRKAAFLRTAARELSLPNVNVLVGRIEELPPQNAAYVSARALAPLDRLMAYLERHLASEGQAWLMKGEQWRKEVEDARKHWRFDLTEYPSRTKIGAAVLKIEGLSHE